MSSVLSEPAMERESSEDDDGGLDNSPIPERKHVALPSPKSKVGV